MKKILTLSILFIILVSKLFSQIEQDILFYDDFTQYQNGSDGSPNWHVIKGDWQVVDGKYLQQNSNYDCASMIDFYLPNSFKLEAEFELLDGDLGVGFIFSSFGSDDISISQMVRFDGNGIFIMGYFQNAEFNTSSSCIVKKILQNTKHQLTLIVDRQKSSYSCYFDNEKIQTDVPLIFPTGYCGLQSSIGKIRFNYVKLTRFTEKINANELNWVRNFAIDQHGLFFIPDEHEGLIKIMNNEGKLERTIGTPTTTKGQLDKPCAVCILNDSNIFVVDRGKNRIHCFDYDGKWIRSFGSKGNGSGEFDDPISIISNIDEQIFIVDKNNNRVQVFNNNFIPIMQFGNDMLIKPQDIAVKDSNLFVINTGKSQIEWFHWTGNNAIHYKSISYGGGEGRGIAYDKNKIYLSLVNEVRLYDTSGTMLKKFFGRELNFIYPQGIKLDEFGNLFIADYFYGRIIRTSADLLDPQPATKFTDNNEVIIRWTSFTRDSGSCILYQNDNPIDTFYESNQNRDHVIKINNLLPSSTYRYRIRPTLITIPRIKNHSRFYTFRTPPEDRGKEFVQLPMATLLFTNVTDDSKIQEGLPQPKPLSSTEIKRIIDQINDGIKFYWINSGMKLFIDNKIIIIDDKLKRSEVYGTEWWYPPRESVFVKYLKMNGQELKNFSSFLYLTCTQEYDTTLKNFVLAGKGGGFTNGVGTGNGYGISWWDVTKTNHNAGNNWLMVHEFNHQLDDIFLTSGYPEYWFNHISPTIGTADKFGEHFDANAFILHMVPQEEWYDLKYTTILKTIDTDQDGIPDNDLRLPLDEVRLNSNPLSIDSDGDGISDFDELKNSNWITEGWGETYGGNAFFPKLNNQDSDGDGINDKEDEYPCYALKSQILYSQNYLQLSRLIDFVDERTTATVFSGWNYDSLYFTFEMNKLVPIKIMLDADANGWFLGRENYLIILTHKNDSIVNIKVQIFDGTDPYKWPHINETLGEINVVTARLLKNENHFQITVAIPKSKETGLFLHENKKISISIGFKYQLDKNGNERYVDIFEPNRLVDFILKK